MKKVAFICVHNSCRSQIAEALGKNQKSVDNALQRIRKKLAPTVQH